MLCMNNVKFFEELLPTIFFFFFLLNKNDFNYYFTPSYIVLTYIKLLHDNKEILMHLKGYMAFYWLMTFYKHTTCLTLKSLQMCVKEMTGIYRYMSCTVVSRSVGVLTKTQTLDHVSNITNFNQLRFIWKHVQIISCTVDQLLSYIFDWVFIKLQFKKYETFVHNNQCYWLIKVHPTWGGKHTE